MLQGKIITYVNKSFIHSFIHNIKTHVIIFERIKCRKNRLKQKGMAFFSFSPIVFRDFHYKICSRFSVIRNK